MSFKKASEAHHDSLNQRAIFDEVQLIEKAIMTATAAGSLTATIGPSSSPAITTGLTVSSVAYNAYNAPTTYVDAASVLAREQMDCVIETFQLLGYTVRRSKIDSTTTFDWIITW